MTTSAPTPDSTEAGQLGHVRSHLAGATVSNAQLLQLLAAGAAEDDEHRQRPTTTWTIADGSEAWNPASGSTDRGCRDD